MLIVCPNCATSYRVEPSSLGAAGRSVRCVRCRTIWFTREPGALAAVTRDFRVDAQSLAEGVAAADPSDPPTPLPGADAEPDQSSPAVAAIDGGHLPEPAPAAFDALAAEQAPPWTPPGPTTTSTSRASRFPSATRWRRASITVRGCPPTPRSQRISKPSRPVVCARKRRGGGPIGRCPACPPPYWRWWRSMPR